MNILQKIMATSAMVPLMGILGSGVHADTITEFVGVFGDGLVFSDPTEGVEPPGIKIVTGAPGFEFTSPNGFAPNGVVNCIMANRSADFVCDAEPGSGKRYKTQLTGPAGLDLVYNTAAGAGVTEYFNYGKTTNLTGNRMLGMQVIVGTGTGADFTPVSATGGVLFDEAETVSGRALDYDGLGGETTGQNPLQRIFMPDGLFGGGGQEGDIGFFDSDNAGFVVVQSGDNTTMTGTVLFNDTHIELFGDGLLDRSQIPDAYFWDDNADPLDESALIAWFNPSAGGWTYGTLGLDDPATVENELDDRLAELATALGLPDVAALDYVPGESVPAPVVALMQADPLFAIGVIEDLSNLNLNFSLDVGDNAVGGFTVRIIPIFAPLIEVAATEYQYQIASTLDITNIPYLGFDPAYSMVLAAIEALPTAAEQQRAIEQLGYSFIGAYGGLSYALGSGQVAALGNGPVWGLDNNLDAWVSFGVAGSTEGGTESGAGFTTETTAIWAGLETHVSPTATLGLMVGGGFGSATIDDNRGQLDAAGFGVAAYGRASFGEGGAVRAILGMQDLTFESTRFIAPAAQTALGETDGQLTFAAVDASWMFQTGAVSYGPMASLAVFNHETAGFTETGADIWNMTVDDMSGSYTLASLGVSAEMDITSGNSVFTPYGHVAYATRSSDAQSVETAYPGMDPMLTLVQGRDDSWVDLGLGVETVLSQTEGRETRIGGEYRGAFFSDEYESHSVRLFVEMTF